MADFTVTLTIPDPKLVELVAALRWHWGPKIVASVDAQGQPVAAVEYTQAELRAKLKTSVEDSLRDIFLRHKVHLRNSQAVDATIAIT